MFYLKEWALVLWDLRLKGLFFAATGLALALTLAFRPSVERVVKALAPEAYARPYFTALFDRTADREEIAKRLRQRPEVAEVQALTGGEARGPLEELLAQLGDDYGVDGQMATAFGLRVVLKGAGMVERGREIRRALEQGHGPAHVTTTDVRLPRVAGLFRDHPVFNYLARTGFAGVALPLFLVWAAAFALCVPHFTRRAWLVERFQRRRRVAAKTAAAGLAAMAATAGLTALALQGPDFTGLALLVTAFSIPWATTMREVQWRPQP